MTTTTILIGDIHLGKRFPYTNKKTAARWEALKHSTLDVILGLPAKFVQLGDLFDGFSVDSAVFVQGYNVASKCEVILAGNHDRSNNTEKASAVELLQELGCFVVCQDIQVLIIEGVKFVMVSHQLTQDKFNEVLETTKQHAEGPLPAVLLLHCNYGFREGNQTENYLRPEIAEDLLKHFSGIVSGHEHNARSPLQGLMMIGSILPMSFGEMTDKYVYGVSSELNTLHRVWAADEHYKKLSYQDFLELPIDVPLQFIEVEGCVDIAEKIHLNKRIVDWYLKSETLIAIKNGTTSFRTEADTDKEFKAEDWVQKVSSQMTADEVAIFNELLGN